MRVLFANCSVEYSGRLSSFLPMAPRLIMVKADSSVLIHCDGGSYKPLNWMAGPASIEELQVNSEDEAAGVRQVWLVQSAKTGDQLKLRIGEIFSETTHDLGLDPGLQKDGVEAHLQELLAAQIPEILGSGWELIRREYPTPVGPVDLMVFDPELNHVAIEVKRRGEIDGVEQLTRYLDLLSRDPLMPEVRGIFAAQVIKPQARTLAEDRGIRCLTLDYDSMRGVDDAESRLF